MSEKIDMDKFDDLTESQVIAKYKEFGIDIFEPNDRPSVLAMIFRHEKEIKRNEAILKVILALFTLVPTILLWMSNIIK